MLSKYYGVSGNQEISFKKARKDSVHPFNQECGVPANCIPCARYQWHYTNYDGSTFVMNNLAGSKSSYLKTTETKFQPIAWLPAWETFPSNWKLKQKRVFCQTVRRQILERENKQSKQKFQISSKWLCYVF